MHDPDSQAEHIFASVLSLDREKRAEYLNEVCRDAPDVRLQVEQLLAEDERAGSFLMQPLLSARRGAAGDGTEGMRAGLAGAAASEANVSASGADTPQFKPGDLVYGRFVVVRYIARGGMGEVYEVEDRQLKGARMALKTILSYYAADPVLHDRFKREVLMAREISDPHVCPIYDLFVWDRPEGRMLFLTMKLLAGETLAQRLAGRGRLPLEEVAAITRQVGSGLAAAHAAGVLHRDIKAANIMLNLAGARVYACITDFGLARAMVQESTALTVQGVPGTPGYVAPELFYGEAPSQASDVFAFGVVVYQMLAGHLPRGAITDAPVRKQLHEAAVPAPWRRMVESCLQPSPARRCNDVAVALQMVPGLALESSARSAPRLHDTRHMLLSRRRVLALAGATVAVSGLGGWVERDRIRFWFEPIPEKRFVALMAWPDGKSSSVVQVILASIENRLARVETLVHNLLVISPDDVAGATGKTLTPAACVSELGANLVLGASLHTTGEVVSLTLQVLDAASQRVFRRMEVKGVAAKLGGLIEDASHAALALLDLPEKEPELSDEQELKRLPAEPFKTFSEAENLANDPNETGLNESIGKYEQVLAEQPHFALGYARLGIAYARLLRSTGVNALSDLAEQNAVLALRYNPRSPTARFSLALAYLYSGRTKQALANLGEALQADPDNPEYMLYEAQAYRDLGGKEGLEKAAGVYERIVKDVRPNYWPAYNEYGFVLARLKRYDDAEKEFEKGSLVAPNVAAPLANLASMYFEKDDGGNPEVRQKNKEAAIDACNRSLARHPNDQAYLILGDCAFEDHDYDKARDYYLNASQIDPNYHLTWRNIGDCYEKKGQRTLVQAYYTKAAGTLSRFVALNPSRGDEWATLAFYHAKTHDLENAQKDLDNARLHQTTDVDSQFMIAQALVLMNRREEALNLLLKCMDEGLSPVDVDNALDLASLQKDPRYAEHVAKARKKKESAS